MGTAPRGRDDGIRPALLRDPLNSTSPRPRRKRRQRRSKIWNLFWGIFFFALGVVGIFIPIMPQVLFFVLSLLFFSQVFPPVRRWMRRFLHRHPKLAHAYKRWRDKARKKRQELIRREKEFAARFRHHEGR